MILFVIFLIISMFVPITSHTDVEIIPCVLSIINQYVSRRTVVFYNEEEPNSDLWLQLTRNMTKPFTVISQDQKLHDMNLLLVLFPEVNTNYSLLLRTLRTNSLFVIVGNRHFSLSNARRILKQFYKFKMIYDILLIPLQDQINLYTSFPYGDNHCSGNGQPVLMETFVKGSFTRKADLFKVGKYWNMHGCNLTCLANIQSPYANLSIGKNGTIQFEGISKEILDFISERLNFKPTIIVPHRYNDSVDWSWFFYNDTMDHIKNYLLTDRADFAMGVFSRLAFTDQAIQFGKESRYECYTWAVPVRAGKKRTVIMNYVEEFTLNFWMLFFASVVAGVFVIVAVTRITGQHEFLQSFLNASMYLFATVVNQPFPVRPKLSSLRLFLGHWLAYLVVVTTAYQAALWSFMTIPWQVRNIDTLQELVDSDLEIGGAQQMLNVIMSMKSNSSNVNKLIKKFKVLPPSDFRDIIKRIETKRDLAVFGEKSHLDSYSRSSNDTLESEKVYIIKGCQYQSVMTFLLFPIGSPLYTPINTMLHRFLRVGLIKRFNSAMQSSDSDSNQVINDNTAIQQQTSSYSAMTLKQCRGIFIILVFGYAIAFVILLCEVVFSNVSKSQRTVNVIVGPKLYRR